MANLCIASIVYNLDDSQIDKLADLDANFGFFSSNSFIMCKDIITKSEKTSLMKLDTDVQKTIDFAEKNNKECSIKR